MDVFIKYKKLLNYYLKDGVKTKLEEFWHHPSRVYHNIDHLRKIIKYIEDNARHVAPLEFDALLLAAFFHDAILDVKNLQNHENDSIEYFKHSWNKDRPMANKIIELIECTKYRKIPIDILSSYMWWADNDEFRYGFKTILENEKKIRKEYWFIPNEQYKKNKLKFIESNFGLFDTKVEQDLMKLMVWINKNY